MGYFKDISIKEQEEFLEEEEQYKHIEAKQEALEEKLKEQKEFDFERDQGARP